MSKKSNKKLHMICLAAFAVLLCAAVWLLGRITEPKYMSGVLEGAMTQEYYNEENSHDVIFVGDCEVYENFSPVTMWEEHGITSYIRGSAQQLIWQSYYLLEEVFERESPKVVVYNVQSMKYDAPQSEAYNRMTLDGMPLSKHKLDAIKASMTENEDMISYLIPFLRYHSRWSELTDEDFEYAFRRDPVTIAGYLMRADVEPMTKLPTAPVLDDYTIGDTCWEYLDEHGLDYINLLDVSDDIGIDMQTDTYDAGLHLNIYGAEKLSRYFADILAGRYGVPDRSEDETIAADWENKCNTYYELLAAQKAELEEYGYLKSWTLGDEK